MLEKTQAVKCAVCPGYHPIEESEEVTITIVKGRGCDLNALTQTRTPSAPFVRAEPNAENEVKIPQDPPQVKKPIIPPGIMSMMLPPDHPGFEIAGAKERRVA